MTLQQEYWWISDGLKAATPFAVGVAVAYIAWQQWRTNHHKLKLDLFDRRFKVYAAATDLLKSLDGRLDVDDKDLQDFQLSIRESVFLFKPEVTEFLSRLARNTRKMRSIARRTEGKRGKPEVEEALEDEFDAVNGELDRDASDLLDIFTPYLDFRKV
jgi:hypothetical protein